MICEPDSVATQHMETYNEQNLLTFNYRRLIWLSRPIFARMVNFLAVDYVNETFVFQTAFNSPKQLLTVEKCC